jgi:AraC family transcriptional regulator
MGTLDRDFPCDRPPRPSPSLQLSRPYIERRYTASWTGIQVETIDVIRNVPYEFHAVSPSHMLALAERGSRWDGETMIGDVAKSTRRDISLQLLLVPAGQRLHGRQKPRVLTRVTYIHVDPAGALLDPDLRFSEIEFAPQLFFQDRDLWLTALKLKSHFEQPLSRAYAEALSIVLAHELSRINGRAIAQYTPSGGLAGWRQKRLREYIAAHLVDEISLIDLAAIAQLSIFHFARAFKQSFGDPPHRYLMGRRIQLAKSLLENRARSVTEIALAVGFANSACLTAAFRRSVGATPTAYRRALA